MFMVIKLICVNIRSVMLVTFLWLKWLPDAMPLLAVLPPRLPDATLRFFKCALLQHEAGSLAVGCGLAAPGLRLLRRPGHLQRQTQRPAAGAALRLPEPRPRGRGPDGNPRAGEDPRVHQPPSLGAVAGQRPLRLVTVQAAGRKQAQRRQHLHVTHQRLHGLRHDQAGRLQRNPEADHECESGAA